MVIEIGDGVMNLWTLPLFLTRHLIDIPGIFYLPIFALLFYLIVLFAVFVSAGQRIELIIFIAFSVAASSYIISDLRPSDDEILKPLLLLMLMIVPTFILIAQMFRGDYQKVFVWGVASIAGWSLSLSWSIWMYALAKS